MKKASLILLAPLLFAAFAAQAETPAPAAPVTATPPTPAATPAAAPAHKAKSACYPDIQALCAGVQKGEGRIQKCLDEHADQVSAACKAEHAQKKAENQAIKAACKTDIKQFCADNKRHGAWLGCLKSHAAQLSPDCAKTLNDAMD